MPIQWGKDWISWIDSKNTAYASKTKLTIWSGVSHNGTWGRAFNPTTKVDGYNIYEWLLLNKRTGGGTTTTPTTPPPTTTPEPTPPTTPKPPTTPTTPTTGNVAPVANAGADQSIPVSWNYFPYLNATPSKDADGWIVNYKWTKISGPASYTFSAPDRAQTKANNLTAGTYVFRVTITDNKGGVDYDDVTVTMTGTGGSKPTTPTAPTTPPPTTSLGAPTAKAGADQVIPISWNYFPLINATTSTDSDGWVKAFKWTKVSGPSSYLIVSPTSGKTKVTGLVKGTYVFRITVTDNDNKTSTDDVMITMK